MNESKYLTISDASSQESFKNGFLSGLSFAYETRKLTTSMEVLEQELSTAIESVKENIEANTTNGKKDELDKLLAKFKNKNKIEDEILEEFLKAQALVIQTNTDFAQSELKRLQKELGKRKLSPRTFTADQKKDFLAILGLQIELAKLEKIERLSIADDFITTGDYEVIANKEIIDQEKEQEKWQNLLNELEIELKRIVEANEQNSTRKMPGEWRED